MPFNAPVLVMHNQQPVQHVQSIPAVHFVMSCCDLIYLDLPCLLLIPNVARMAPDNRPSTYENLLNLSTPFSYQSLILCKQQHKPDVYC